MDYILIIAPLFEGEEMRIANKYGYKTIVIGERLNMNHVFMADLPIEMNLSDFTLVLNKIRELEASHAIKGVVSLNENYIELAAYIRSQEKLGFGPSYEAIQNCKHKDYMRNLLREQSAYTVPYRVLDVNDIPKEMEDMDYPVIVKPSADTGSRNIYLCHSEEEVLKAICLIKGKLSSGKIMIEGYIEGPEYSAELYLAKGEINLVAITEKEVISAENPVEIGHTVPAMLSEHNDNEIREMLYSVVPLLGIDNSVIHVEFKITDKGPKIIEVNGRPGGDNICTLVKYSTGVDLFEVAVCLSIGKYEEYKVGDPIAQKSMITFFYSDYDGVLDRLELDQVAENPKVKVLKMYRGKGDPVTKTVDSFSRLGYFISLDLNKDEIKKYSKLVGVRKNEEN